MNQNHRKQLNILACACTLALAFAVGVPSLKIMERVISQQQQGEQSLIAEPLRVTGNTITKEQLIAYLSQHREVSAMDEVLDTLSRSDSTKKVALTLAPQESSAASKQLHATHKEVFFVAEVAAGRIFQRIDPKQDDAAKVFDRWTAILKESYPDRQQALYAALATDAAEHSAQLYLLNPSGEVRLVDLFAPFSALADKKAAPVVAVLPATTLSSYSQPGATLNLSDSVTDFISLSPASDGSGYTITRLREHLPGYDDDQPYAVVTVQDGDEQSGYQDEFAFIFPISVGNAGRACGNEEACSSEASATPPPVTTTTPQVTPFQQQPTTAPGASGALTTAHQHTAAATAQQSNQVGSPSDGLFAFFRRPGAPARKTPTPFPGGAVATTAPAACGDGNADPNEECDDGNREDGDGCSGRCKKECELLRPLGLSSNELEMMTGGRGFSIDAYDPYPEHAPAACEIAKIVATSPKPSALGPIRNALGGSIGNPKLQLKRDNAKSFTAWLSGLRWYGEGDGLQSCIHAPNNYEFTVTAVFKNGSRAVADAVVFLGYDSVAGKASSAGSFANNTQTPTLSGYPRKKGVGWECCVGVEPDPDDNLVRVTAEVTETHPKELQYASLANREEEYHVSQYLGQVDFSNGGMSMNGMPLDNDAEILRRYGVTRSCTSTVLRSKEVACSVAREKARKQTQRIGSSFVADYNRWHAAGKTKERSLSDMRCYIEYTAKRAIGWTREKVGLDYPCGYVLPGGCPKNPPRPPYFWDFVGK